MEIQGTKAAKEILEACEGTVVSLAAQLEIRINPNYTPPIRIAVVGEVTILPAKAFTIRWRGGHDAASESLELLNKRTPCRDVSRRIVIKLNNSSMDTTDFKRDDLPPLSPSEAARRKAAFFKAGKAPLRDTSPAHASMRRVFSLRRPTGW